MLKLTLSLTLMLSAVVTQCSQKLEFDGLDYTLVRKNKVTKIASHDVDPLLRQMTKVQLRDFQTRYKVSSKKLSDGSRVVRPNLKLNGGGLLGAKIGFWVGRIGVHVGARIGFVIIAACSGPAFPAVYAGLEAACAVPVEAASNVAGLTCGIIGGVATGPV